MIEEGIDGAEGTDAALRQAEEAELAARRERPENPDAELAIAALEEDGTISGSGGADVDVATVLRAALRKLSKQ